MDTATDPSTKTELLARVRAERQRLERTLADLQDAVLLAPELEGGRSMKDLLSHLTGWEQRMVRWVEESLKGQKPDRPAPDEDWPDLDQLNQEIFLEKRERPLPRVRAEAEASYRRAVAVIETMTERDLFDGDRFAWRKGDPMWHLVAANTYAHYREHRQEIEAWLERER